MTNFVMTNTFGCWKMTLFLCPFFRGLTMARISKGFAITTAVLGVLAFVFGLAVAICAWKLQGKVSQFSLVTSDSTVAGVTFHDFWWGGLFVSFIFVPNLYHILHRYNFKFLPQK